MRRAARATGAVVQTTVHKLSSDVLGTCGKFEEMQLGSERYNLFTGCPQAKSVTIILRGGAQQFIDETERSLHDSIMVVRRAFKTSRIVGGAGSIEMSLSAHLREQARTIPGKQQLVMQVFGKALEAIPSTLAANSGLDPVDVLNKLRQLHATSTENVWFGVDCMSTGGVMNAYDAFVWEPSLVRLNALRAATDVTCLVLSIDETVRNPKSQPEEGGRAPRPGGAGRGRPMMR
eukprot:GHVU01128615.1.p1 GENE.GHVU01128615.1~~GHVU01128615.1.p1  ORF type:complete len:233 (-),score=39.12 GHVU01128615.1:2923-3621(-)